MLPKCVSGLPSQWYVLSAPSCNCSSLIQISLRAGVCKAAGARSARFYLRNPAKCSSLLTRVWLEFDLIESILEALELTSDFLKRWQPCRKSVEGQQAGLGGLPCLLACPLFVDLFIFSAFHLEVLTF